MTSQCGIYKLNRRLTELETGYSLEKIKECLHKFEQYGKVVISQSTTEIMLINWFKHNYKSSKRSVAQANRELKDVKDKEMLKLVYDYCLKRQYPIKEIFSGVEIPGIKIEKEEIRTKEIVEAAQEIKEEAGTKAQEEDKINSGSRCEESSGYQDTHLQNISFLQLQ
jgi:hypothetical protein